MGIVFRDMGPKRVSDGFTGGVISGVVYRCGNCLTRYGEESVKVIESENSGKCVSCNKPQIKIE
ncbi:MAG: hypothetical protein JKX76_15485 [Colwellia sp.]|nr:hypothetical protein [Colwellia sp.]